MGCFRIYYWNTVYSTLQWLYIFEHSQIIKIIDGKMYYLFIYLSNYLRINEGVKIKRSVNGIRGYKNIYMYYVLLSNRKIGI